MGAYDIFEIVATGRGAHAAMPHLGRDPMPFAAHVINALQTIVSRNIHPLEAGVVSVTQVHGGDTWNVIPQEVVLRGTVRSFLPEIQDLIERRMGEIVAGIAATFEMTATLRYERRYPATINSPEETPPRAGSRDSIAWRRQRRHRPDAVDGLRGLRVHAAGQARLLHLAGRRARTRHAQPAQPALRLQRHRRPTGRPGATVPGLSWLLPSPIGVAAVVPPRRTPRGQP